VAEPVAVHRLPQQSGAVLAVSGLRAGVSGRVVLDGVDASVGPGEVHVVMGPNGSGKSTLANVLMGKPGYEVLDGSVRLEGRDLVPMAPWERARQGLFVAPQYPVEVPGVRLRRVLAEASAGRTAALPPPQWEVEAAAVGLSEAMLDRAVNVDLSGGERKRSETLQLAVLRPKVAVLDEIDSGLDVDGLRAVARRVRRAVEEWGMAVVAITHYRRLVAELHPDVVHVFVGGRIVRSGGPELADELERTGYGADAATRPAT
jgi:Fe-S cluster assembly ATP-binding protein